jgi:hypothetical protein
MLVLNLACGHAHSFEGWFGSSDDFDSQMQRGLVACPACGDTRIERRPNAPRLNVGATQASEAERIEAGKAALQLQLQQVVRQVLARTEDVGLRFAEEARRIHYGESEERAIRGRASLTEAEALADEGIAVLALPTMLPDGPLQ